VVDEASTDGFMHTDLWLAIEKDNPARLAALLSAGVPPTYDSADGWTPLHHAVDVEGDAYSQDRIPCDLRLVRLVLEAGADVGAVYTARGRRKTPLDLATRYGHDAAVNAITTAGGKRADQ